jgi:hypothetical protein
MKLMRWFAVTGLMCACLTLLCTGQAVAEKAAPSNKALVITAPEKAAPNKKAPEKAAPGEDVPSNSAAAPTHQMAKEALRKDVVVGTSVTTDQRKSNEHPSKLTIREHKLIDALKYILQNIQQKRHTLKKTWSIVDIAQFAAFVLLGLASLIVSITSVRTGKKQKEIMDKQSLIASSQIMPFFRVWRNDNERASDTKLLRQIRIYNMGAQIVLKMAEAITYLKVDFKKGDKDSDNPIESFVMPFMTYYGGGTQTGRTRDLLCTIDSSSASREFDKFRRNIEGKTISIDLENTESNVFFYQPSVLDYVKIDYSNVINENCTDYYRMMPYAGGSKLTESEGQLVFGDCALKVVLLEDINKDSFLARVVNEGTLIGKTIKLPFGNLLQRKSERNIALQKKNAENS